MLMTPEDFEPWIGREVRVSAVPEPVMMTLVRVQRMPHLKSPYREAFTLWFESAADAILLDGVYEFDCGRGGPYLIHIVRRKEQPDGRFSYNAVFN